MLEGTDTVFNSLKRSQPPRTFLTNLSKRRIYRCKIHTVTTETLIV